jgi:Beta-lactamase
LGDPPVGGAGFLNDPVRYRVHHEALHGGGWLQLVGEGRLSLDLPIVEVVDLTGTTISPAVTVRQLLTHTSGIADDADEEAGETTRRCGSTGRATR